MSDQNAARRAHGQFTALLPLAGFLAIGALFLIALLTGDPAKIPSALIGQSAPALNLPALDDGAPLTDADLRQGHVTVVNVFASWCVPCKDEAATLMKLAKDPETARNGLRIIGVAQKDEPENARRFLGINGDPYAKVGLDREGLAGIDWGVYGVPETFIIRGDGVIAYKFVGPISDAALAEVLTPEIAKAMH